MKKIIPFLIIVFILIPFSGCLDNDIAIKVDLNKKEAGLDGNGDSETIKIALANVISPEESFVYYNDLLDYISNKTNRSVTIVQRKTYQEINDLVRKQIVDVAFISSRPYVDGKRNFDMELLVAPVVKGKTTYRSYLIVHKDSNIKNFEDLRGKTFAFTDPISNSGKLYPTYMLATMNETPDTFFKITFYTYSHDRSIQAVNDKLVDGAAVDSLVWDYKNATVPDFTKNTKIILESPLFGNPPVVVPHDLDPLLKEEIRTILLDMHKDAEGREILDGLMIDRFIEVDDDLYNSIRDMENIVGDN